MEESTPCPVQNHRQNCVEITENVPSGDAQSFVASVKKDYVTRLITLRPIASIMRLTVNLNGKPALQANEIDYIPAEWELTPEAQAARPLTKLLPQKHFGQRHLATKFPSELDVVVSRSYC